MFSNNRFPNLSVDMKSAKSTQKRILDRLSFSACHFVALQSVCGTAVRELLCSSEGKNFQNV